MGEKLRYALYMALFRPLSWLPLGVLYVLSDALRFIFYRCLHYRIKVVRANLSSCYPHKSPEELLRIERDFYRQFCDNIVETVKLLHISDRQMRRRISVENVELVEQAAAADRPVILYLGHYCNWEWVPSITLFYDNPKVSAQIYKPLHDKAFDRLMLKVRSRFHSVSIEKDKAFRELLRMRRNDGTFMVGFIADHRTSSQATKYHTTFLRHDTMFYPGGEEIGRRIGAEFIYLDVSRPRRGHYRFTLKPIVPDENSGEYPVTRKYLSMLQDTIDRAPAHWLWSHRRWLGPAAATVAEEDGQTTSTPSAV